MITRRRQSCTDETLDSLNSSSQRHVTITQTIARMIVTDFQLFSVVEDEGFQVLLRVLVTIMNISYNFVVSVTSVISVHQKTCIEKRQ